jgi:DNA-binding MarR family transcriptional regulator
MDEFSISKEELTHVRQRHIGRLLQQAERAYRGEAVKRLQQRDHQHVTLAHVALLSYPDLDGTRLTVLAERAGITKQSMRQLAIELETLHYITRSDDPTDRRASLIRFTDDGWRFLQDANIIKHEREARYSEQPGEVKFQRFREALHIAVHDWRGRTIRALVFTLALAQLPVLPLAPARLRSTPQG